MSKTSTVGLRGQEFWVFDVSLSLALAETVRLVELMPETERPSWWSSVDEQLRVHATINDLFFDLDLGLTDPHRAELADLFDQAATRLTAREVFTREQAAAWKVLDDYPVMFRGSEPFETAPAAELASALASLIRGTLPPAPPRTWWLYGWPGGRTTLDMRM